MPKILELIDQNGQLQKYMVMKTYPQIGDFIVIDSLPESPVQFRQNISSTISPNKSYQVIDVHNVTGVIIKNDLNDNCHLKNKEYKVVKPVTDDELLNIKYRNEALDAFQKLLRKQNSTS